MRLPSSLILVSVLLLVSCGKVETPPAGKGTAGMDPDSPEYIAFKADIPLYPDSHMPERSSNIRTDGEQTRFEIVMLTKDPPARVSSYYEDKLKLVSTKDGEGFKLWGFTPKHNAATIDISKDGEMTKINAVAIAGGL